MNNNSQRKKDRVSSAGFSLGTRKTQVESNMHREDLRMDNHVDSGKVEVKGKSGVSQAPSRNKRSAYVDNPSPPKMTTIKKIEKGCGKQDIERLQQGYTTLHINCGDVFIDEITQIERRYLCPTCKAKLQTKKEDLEIFLGLMELLNNEEVYRKYDKKTIINVIAYLKEELKQKLEGKQEGER